MQRLLSLPLLLVLSGAGGLAMLVPAMHAAQNGDWRMARAFLFSGALVLALVALIGLAVAANPRKPGSRGDLLSLVGAYALLPLALALPLYEVIPGASFGDVWWEMVSALTTTGATLFPAAELPATVHLWRAMVGWLGGYFTLIAAVAILAPLNLGGFEVMGGAPPGQGAMTGGTVETGERIGRYARIVTPAYGGLTLILWIALILTGQAPLAAACHAMATLSTSGISPTGGLSGGGGGIGAEMVVFVFLILALSRRTLQLERPASYLAGLARDPELRLGLTIVAAVPVLLFLRHWSAAIEGQAAEDAGAALGALWGALFTVLSFLSTTGFESAGWADARAWSGLRTPGLILAGLAVVGGGVATTAGGVRLLRVYALFRHGQREMEKLIHPHSIGGAGVIARQMRRQGAQIAWIFFMLFALSIATIMLALSLTGLGFENSVALAVSALSNTGPLASLAAEHPIAWGALAPAAKAVLAAAMVLGRLETLAVIALLNPEFWRHWALRR